MRWVFRLIWVLVVLVGVAVGSLLLLPGDRIANIAADQVKAQTGRVLEISGDVNITLWPVIGVSTGPVSFSNADWSDAGPMFSADSLSIGVNTAGLFGGDIRITKVEAENPTIRLEQRKDGRANWLFSAPASAEVSTDSTTNTGAASANSPRTLTLEKMNVTNARLIYAVEGSDTIDQAGVDLSLVWPDPAGAATIVATVRPGGEPVEVRTTIDRFAIWITGVAQAVTADISGPGGEVSFAGAAGVFGELSGNVSIRTPNTGAFLNALGLGPFDFPKGLGQSADIAAKVTLTREGKLAFREAVLNLDGNAIRGAADIQLSDAPKVNAQFTAGALNLRSLSADSKPADGQSSGTGGSGTGGSGNGGAAQKGWSKAPIDASGLASFDGDVSLAADSIDLGTLKLGASRLLMRVERSRAVFEIREIQAYEGVITGEFVANNRSGLSVGGAFSGTGVEMNGLLSDLAGLTRLSGKANAELSFLGVGNSVDAIMKSLSGKGVLKLGKGLISGIDLDRLMRSGDGGGGTTVFDSLTATMAITDGNLVNEDLLLLLSNFKADGIGRVGLGVQDIDYLFTPVALRANSGSGLAIPVRIRGPWANPKITPDVSAAIDLNLSVQKEKLEKKAREEVERTLQKELGVKAKEGQSTEDALQDKVEDELKRGLLKLLE